MAISAVKKFGTKGLDLVAFQNRPPYHYAAE